MCLVKTVSNSNTRVAVTCVLSLTCRQKALCLSVIRAKSRLLAGDMELIRLIRYQPPQGSSFKHLFKEH